MSHANFFPSMLNSIACLWFQLDATSSEKVMASRMFLADEKQQLAHDKQQLMDEKQKILNEMNPEKQETTDTLSESAKGSV